MEGLCPLCDRPCKNLGPHFKYTHNLRFRDWLPIAPRLCGTCGELITQPKSPAITNYVLKRRFCSSKCWGLSRRGKEHPKYKAEGSIQKTCEACAKPIRYPKSGSGAYYVLQRRFCSVRCRGAAFKGKNHPGYKGGTLTTNGYRAVSINGKSHLEHRVVMEGILGRKLGTREHVHHLNGDGLDNRPENLQLVTPEEHTLMHEPHKGHTPESRRKAWITRRERHGY